MMKQPPKTGTSHEMQFPVDESRTVEFAEHGIPPVLATPWLIWSLEHTALDLMKPFLDEGEMTVGVVVEMEHLAPTPLGQTVTCRARVLHTDGPVVSFQIEAHDAGDQIARGIHKRRVVKAERFAALVKKKAGMTNA